LENCRAQVTAYFDQSEEQIRKQRRPFGFLPLFSKITTQHAMDHIKEYVQTFNSHCDVKAILKAAMRIKESAVTTMSTDQARNTTRSVKRRKLDGNPRSREDIEAAAIGAGAAPSA